MTAITWTRRKTDYGGFGCGALKRPHLNHFEINDTKILFFVISEKLLILSTLVAFLKMFCLQNKVLDSNMAAILV